MITDELLIDYIEGECDADLKQDIERLLANSSELRRRYNMLSNLKRELMSSEQRLAPLPAPLSSSGSSGSSSDSAEDYFKQFEDRIMARVGTTEMQPKVWIQIQNNGWKYAAAVVVVVLGGWMLQSGLGMRHPLNTAAHHQPSTEINRLMVETTISNPASLGDSVISDEDKIDLFMDVTAQKMERQSDEENQHMLEKLKRN